jgi:hypothetical protein
MLVSQMTVNHGQVAVVDSNFPAITEANECIVEHSREPRAMLTHGTQSLILGEEDVGVVIHVHLKYNHENITNPK